MAEPVSLAEAKEYLRVLHADEDAKIAAMIPRARRWVEEHTGHLLEQRQVTEYRAGFGKFLRLAYRPVATVDAITYTDENGATTTLPAADYFKSVGYPVRIYPNDTWPTLGTNGEIAVTYTAGYATAADVDERLVGAVLALIEGEHSEGYAYPARAVTSAERCCAYLRAMVA